MPFVAGAMPQRVREHRRRPTARRRCYTSHMHHRRIALRLLGLRAFATLLALLALVPSRSQDTALQVYEVELIIFRQTNPTATVEDWALEETRAKSNTPRVADGEESVDPNVATTAPISGLDPSIELLDAGRLRMNNIAAALRRNPNYQPIAHVGWAQPGFALNNPRPLAIESLVPEGAGLTGTVTLMRGRYLHLGLNLTLHSSADNQNYVLREQRRMRKSGEKHYLDHPHFGVIALVTPRG